METLGAVFGAWQGALNGLNQVEVSQCSLCIMDFSFVFTSYLSNAAVSSKSPHYFHALVALKLLVSLISRLVACSARIVGDKHIYKQTDKHRPSTVTLAAHARRGLTKGTGV